MPRKPFLIEWVNAGLALAAAALTLTVAEIAAYGHEVKGWQSFLLIVGAAACFGLSFRDLVRVVSNLRFWRAVRHLPERVQIQEQGDGSLVAFVTRADGEPRIVPLPEGYDPHEDEGRYLMELLTKSDA